MRSAPAGRTYGTLNLDAVTAELNERPAPPEGGEDDTRTEGLDNRAQRQIDAADETERQVYLARGRSDANAVEAAREVARRIRL